MTTVSDDNNFERVITREIKLPRVPGDDQNKKQMIIITPHKDPESNQFLLVCQKVTKFEGTDTLIRCGDPVTLHVTHWELVEQWFTENDPPTSFR